MEPQEPKIEIPLPNVDVQKIGERLNERAVAEKIDLHTKETVRESIQTISSMPASQSQSINADLDILPDYTKNYSPEDKQVIENLLQAAADKCLNVANGLAKGEAPYILDAFHDALAEKLLPYLKQKGIIK